MTEPDSLTVSMGAALFAANEAYIDATRAESDAYEAYLRLRSQSIVATYDPTITAPTNIEDLLAHARLLDARDKRASARQTYELDVLLYADGLKGAK